MIPQKRLVFRSLDPTKFDPGSVRLVTDQNAGIVTRHEYLPYAEEIPNGRGRCCNNFGNALNEEDVPEFPLNEDGVHPESETVKLGTTFSEGKGSEMKKPNRVFTVEFREAAAKRILQGESVSQLHQELQIKRSVLYRWRDQYRREGLAGLDRKVGRPPGVPNPSTPKPGVSAEDALRSEIATLQRKVGQQALQLDFFERAFKRVKESSRNSRKTGATASTERSGQ